MRLHTAHSVFQGLPGLDRAHIARLLARRPDLLEHVPDGLEMRGIKLDALHVALQRHQEHIARRRCGIAFGRGQRLGRETFPPVLGQAVLLPGQPPPWQAQQQGIMGTQTQPHPRPDRIGARGRGRLMEQAAENRLPRCLRPKEHVEQHPASLVPR